MVSKWLMPLYFTDLSGTIAKSSPLDIATKNIFPLSVVCSKGLKHMLQV